MRLLVTVLSLLAVETSASRPHRYEKLVERDVVIVGGGSSGTYAAVRLLDEDVSVVVLEKEDHLGGHTVTYTDPDTHQPFNLGVIIYHESEIVRNYFGRFGVALKKSADFNGGSLYYDFDTGRPVDYTPVSAQALGAVIQRYAQLISTKYPYLSLGYDLPDPVPKELLEPYSEFIKKNGFEDLVQFVNNIGSNAGDLLKRPTLYGIKLFSPLLIKAAADGFINAASGDNRDLYRGAQKLLKKQDSVLYKSTITKIRRSADGVMVWIDTPGQKVLVKAKKLVFAIPPLKKNLQKVGLDLTSKESKLFAKFTGFLYGSAVFTHSGFDATKSFTNVGTNTPYHLLRLPGSFTYGPLIGKVATNKISTYYGGLDPTLSEKQIKNIIEDQLCNLEEQGAIGPGEPHFKYFGNHSPYHMHVSKKDVEEGFYKNVYALEGQHNTFWTGAAFVDNDSTLLWTWTEAYLLPRILASLKK
ncbi:flavin-containing superfamily amine oxidase-like protein [Thelonectria olida]|uniref:Flavin-containing superfamily amine oxidase-like protein n=1 Tax=Thelonectria olida TaxID=1576542 RepID=A0A9P9AVD8_9HYPO|nr:flavin-containing superfamily amine oxidase-like protein [Thelonectria olida]